MSIPAYQAAFVYSTKMNDSPASLDAPIRLYRDRSAAAAEAGTATGLVPGARVLFHDEELLPDKTLHRWVFLKNGTATGATEWYRSPNDAEEEYRVQCRKRVFLFDNAMPQTGFIA